MNKYEIDAKMEAIGEELKDFSKKELIEEFDSLINNEKVYIPFSDESMRLSGVRAKLDEMEKGA